MADLAGERRRRFASIQHLLDPTAEDESDPVDRLCEQIEAQLRISVPLDARAQLMGAATAVKFWTWADTRSRKPGETRIRTQRFFTFVIMAYEISKRERAGVTWDPVDGTFEGPFYEFAKICGALLPDKLRPKGNVALGRVLARAGKRRTADQALGKPRGPRPKERALP
jgi:hypothetical protein